MKSFNSPREIPARRPKAAGASELDHLLEVSAKANSAGGVFSPVQKADGK